MFRAAASSSSNLPALALSPRRSTKPKSRLGTVASDSEAKNPAISPRISLIKLKNSSHSFEARPLPQRGLKKDSLQSQNFVPYQLIIVPMYYIREIRKRS